MDPGVLQDELTCSMCLRVYQDPVTLPCQHSFCLNCIERAWAQTAGPKNFECPQCHRKFKHKPTLERNATLYSIVAVYNQKSSPAHSPNIFCDNCDDKPFQAVKTCLTCFASFCFLHLKPHLRNKAYQDHMLIVPGTKDVTMRQCNEHKKILEFYCEDEGLCICVSCTIIGKHKSHTLLSLDQAQATIKVELEAEIEKLQTEQEIYSRKQRDLETSETDTKTQINDLKENLLKSFSEWRRKLEEDEASTMSLIDEEGHQALSRIRSCCEALKKRTDLLKLIDRETQNLVRRDHLSFIQNSRQLISRVTDTRRITKLNVTELTLNLPSISQFIQERLNGWEKYQSDILRIVDSTEYVKPSNVTDFTYRPSEETPVPEDLPQPSFEISKKAETSQDSTEYMKPSNVTDFTYRSSEESPVPEKLPQPSFETSKKAETSQDSTKYRETLSATHPLEGSSGAVSVVENVLQLPTDINRRAGSSQGKSSLTLDPMTANYNLVLSDDLRSVTWTKTEQPYPHHPERFKDCPQILCSQSFSSGSHSWDVETDGDYWRVGIVYESIEREGKMSYLGNSYKSWSLDFIAGYVTARHNSQFIVLPLLPSANRIRVHLDYEAGTLSFFQVTDSLKHLYTFQSTFTEPVFPAFYSWDKSLKLLTHPDI
ncbi:E3 ubiquitin/ISG15 ligase TRIM25-like [Chiloscyllium plagiosum]|uniref:E3 ubiquitin/ISG15 ligase TRIM25-like n=1 Tax=Chiloscyllium plagiosum TaxID=36176 RepID=UPI001CB85DDD|nr:E3 ubiquitin/ISG15 ligase TRIM25-like [Chiloscyllium plagiosum]